MNTEYIEKEFKKRFSDTDRRIVVARSGVLCPLMGFYNIPGSRVMTCMLSMSSYTALRKFQSDIVRVQKLSENICIVNSLKNRPNRLETAWAENSLSVFFNSSPMLDSGLDALMHSDTEPSDRTADRASAMAALAKLYDLNLTRDDAAAICGGGKESITPYRLSFAHKPGYGTAIINTDCVRFPLPMQNYKLVLVRDVQKNKTNQIPLILEGLENIREIFPNIISFEDISSDEFERMKHFIKKRRSANYISHIIYENERIAAAVTALKGFNYEQLFTIINQSQRSAQLFWDIPYEIADLSDLVLKLDGVVCSHFEENGIYFIVKSDFTDNAINNIRHYYKQKAGQMPTFYINSIL